MGNFRSDNRGGFGGRSRENRFGGRGGGGFGRGGDRGGFGRDRDSDGPREMFSATCNKCGKQCQVPFKPTGSKPVFCSDCFRNNDSSSFSPRDQGRPSVASSGATNEQFAQINAKLDKILRVMQQLELEEIDESEDSEEESEDDEDSQAA